MLLTIMIKYIKYYDQSSEDCKSKKKFILNHRI